MGRRPRLAQGELTHRSIVVTFAEETDVATEADGRKAVIDVVAISQSSFSGRPWIKGIDQKDAVSILWVEWDQGIAYRVASGYVNEDD